MRKLKFSTRRATWTMISSLVSSILTNMLYDGLTSNSYEITKDGDKLICIAVEKYSFFQMLLMIACLFLLIWIILAIIFPIIWNRAVMLIHWKGLKHTRDETIEVYNEFRNEIILLEKEFNTLNANIGPDNKMQKILYSQRLLSCVNKLHRFYTTANMTVLKGIFRQVSLLDSIATHIAPYEFEATLDCASELLNQLKKTGLNNTLSDDCDKASSLIEEIKTSTHPYRQYN